MKSFFTVWNPQVLVNGTLLKLGLGRKDWMIVLLLVLVLLLAKMAIF